MNKIIKNIGKCIGKKIALAYSGGLDTNISVYWISRYCRVYSFLVDIGQLNVNDVSNFVDISYNFGSHKTKIIDLRLKIISEAYVVINSLAFYVRTGSDIYYNVTPVGRVIITRSIVMEMRKRKIKIWSDGSTYKGNDIERFFRYCIYFDDSILFYKPWLDKRFIELYKGRNVMNNIFKRTNFISNKFSIDSNIIGNTYEGNNIENLCYDLTYIRFKLCGYVFKDIKYSTKVSISFLKGVPYKFNNYKINNHITFFNNLNTISSKHKLGISDQIEERITNVKSRGIYESPGMYVLHNVYERLLSVVYNYDIIFLHRENGKILGKLLYFGKWCERESIVRLELSKKINLLVTGIIKIKILYNKIFYIKTVSKFSRYDKDLITMEHSRNNILNPLNRIGQLNISLLSLSR